MNKKFQFSKVVLGAAVVTWIISIAFGWWYVFTRDAGLLEILTCVSSPVAVAYGFYAWKSKAENVIKMSKDIKKDVEKTKRNGVNVDEETQKIIVGAVANALSSVLGGINNME